MDGWMDIDLSHWNYKLAETIWDLSLVTPGLPDVSGIPMFSCDDAGRPWPVLRISNIQNGVYSATSTRKKVVV